MIVSFMRKMRVISVVVWLLLRMREGVDLFKFSDTDTVYCIVSIKTILIFFYEPWKDHILPGHLRAMQNWGLYIRKLKILSEVFMNGIPGREFIYSFL